MGKKALRVIGLMSGTSADGIDVALAEVSGAPPALQTTLVAHTTLPMSGAVRKEILRVAEGGSCTAADIGQLNFRVGEEFAAAASAGCRKFGLKLQQVQLIGSHGQTIFHSGAAVPFLGKKTASTLQIGEPAIIAARTGIPTVADFRVADMAVGGQGAPLVPYVDWLLLRDERVGRVALNLGGIGNVTVLPAGERNPAKVIAFDTGPGNMIIDALVAHFSGGRVRYDKDARMARRGQCVNSLLQELLRDPYLRLKPPKSTGREHYGKEFVRTLLGKARRLHARSQDLVRTATVFTALSVVDALHRYVLPRVKIGEVLVSGGGAKNPLIIAQLAAALAPIKVLRSSEVGIDEDAKEAYAFALLAYEAWNRRTGNLPSATGASREMVLGKICWP
ncbi:MAG TPA: anhydro-N-acetylmuramic acid kinase [Candidatus Eremiobacteraceae bacterium]|nr:anhydro-N-acetylmuramic acid kinase [Candidatus Eremiobacteraceae bacterium]